MFDMMQSELNNAIIDLSDELLKSIQLQIASINYIKDHAKSKVFKFSERQCLGNDKLRLPKEMGVYLIFHGTRLGYVGYGNIASRVSRFKKGLTDIKSKHHGAIKARKVDANPLNYEVSAVVISDPDLAATVETYYIEYYSPLYSTSEMAGK
jgi:hypothetical protein